MAQTPLELLTVIAAPALITNASSVLVLSTSNRFARAVDRSRAMAVELAKGGTDQPSRISLLRSHQIAKRRTLILVRAMATFYLAVGSFASGTFTGLIGAAVEHFGFERVAPYFTAAALGLVAVGTLSIATGAVMLVMESQLALRGLAEEASAH